ncbi:MAG TPA: hypothetical protein VFD69_07580 [Vicinamibacterales bacterium]|nr:hypothetical protein [Vicinamibacterales bacterium]
MAKKRSARSASRRTKTRAAAPKKKSAARRAAPRKTAGKAARKAAPKKAKRAAARRPSELFAPVKGAERREIGHVLLEVGKAGAARVKRMVYPAGFHWSKDMKPVVGTDLCMHAHVGFLVHGEIHIEYPDGCVIEHRAPQIIAIEPGHDGWVVGKEPVVMIEFDFERDTIARLGMPSSHTHST